MILDIHAHLMSSSFSASQRFNLWNKILFRKLGIASPNEFNSKICNDLEESPVEKVILSAIEGSKISAGNQEVIQFCKQHRNFLYGANLHPYSPTLENDVRMACHNGAVLVKILPSFQNVDLASPRCRNFWELMKHHKLPVLIHTGPEHTFRGNNQLNAPSRLTAAADMGITLICAHCGCRMMLHERDYFHQWKSLAINYPNVYGDVSGFSGCVRHYFLKQILKHEQLRKRILFGTDYPSYPYVLKHNHPNIFIGWVNFYRQAGCTEDFFHRSQEILNVFA